jgi:hypothetical protein
MAKKAASKAPELPVSDQTTTPMPETQPPAPETDPEEELKQRAAAKRKERLQKAHTMIQRTVATLQDEFGCKLIAQPFIQANGAIAAKIEIVSME